MMAVSVVICTIEGSGREQKLKEIIRCLQLQDRIELEIIIVCQVLNPSFRIEIEGANIVMTDICGSGEVRNRGAKIAKHELICFLDDDTYPVGNDFFQRAESELRKRNIDFLTCNIRSTGRVKACEPISHDVVLNRRTIMANMWEPGLMLYRSDFNNYRFDPTLGIGCVHGSSEGFDFGVRLIAAGKRGTRIASLLIDHPPLNDDVNNGIERAFFYGLGNGATLVQHGYYVGYIFAIIRTIARLFVSLMRGKWAISRTAFVRLVSLCVGPFLPRRPARILPLRTLHNC
ncbi:glycosyltransferase family 2 protein [Ancylobacter sp. MQZ15Z-1]|uniref:Glycosyltransferase family 2 protein n=1 Tax=Ancylobacter mangrovi TaxID=2972472 RepID=A0A9X2PGY5_9HYPH|nr:glycosyltransferase family A protein [Ancylobacter mangrovi]MCS0496876.1 glycosyltransferase family 2 protein [Ancylobacter mangrovi]